MSALALLLLVGAGCTISTKTSSYTSQTPSSTSNTGENTGTQTGSNQQGTGTPGAPAQPATNTSGQPSQGTACTMEAKLCPDGSYVGRTGPTCEFTPCLGEEGHSLTKTYKDTKKGIEYQAPLKFTTGFITVQEWPPSIEVSSKPFSCAGDLRVFHERSYCVTETTEGAAGSIYHTYIYSTQKEGRVVILRFSLRYVQCGNFDDPDKNLCEREQTAFVVTGIVDQIVSSLRFL